MLKRSLKDDISSSDHREKDRVRSVRRVEDSCVDGGQPSARHDDALGQDSGPCHLCLY